MNTKIITVLALMFLGACTANKPASPSASATKAAKPIYEINQVVGNLYRARSNNHYTLFLITQDGAVLTDPLNTTFAQWLKNELAERFNSTVRYVLFTHHHWDHASGGAVFADTAELIGHENMLTGLALPLPANYVAADVNGDGVLQRDEAGGGAKAQFDLLDTDNNGEVSGAELNVDITPPTTTYTDTHTIYLGAQEIQMVYAGNNHSDDASIIYFGEESVVFAADWLSINALPRTFYNVSLESWIESVERMLALNPTHVIPAHGSPGRKADLVAYGQYFRDLRDAAKAAVASGISQQDFQDNISLEAYSEWTNYEAYLSNNAGEAYQLALSH